MILTVTVTKTLSRRMKETQTVRNRQSANPKKQQQTSRLIMFVIYAVFSEFVTMASCYACVVNRIVLILHLILCRKGRKSWMRHGRSFLTLSQVFILCKMLKINSLFLFRDYANYPIKKYLLHNLSFIHMQYIVSASIYQQFVNFSLYTLNMNA